MWTVKAEENAEENARTLWKEFQRVEPTLRPLQQRLYQVTETMARAIQKTPKGESDQAKALWEQHLQDLRGIQQEAKRLEGTLLLERDRTEDGGFIAYVSVWPQAFNQQSPDEEFAKIEQAVQSQLLY